MRGCLDLQLRLRVADGSHVGAAWGGVGGGAEPSALSTATLHGLPRLDGRPINLVVYQGPYVLEAQGGLILGGGSRLDAFSAYPDRTSATQRCPWRDNWYTGGPSFPVLSYWGKTPANSLRPR